MLKQNFITYLDKLGITWKMSEGFYKTYNILNATSKILKDNLSFKNNFTSGCLLHFTSSLFTCPQNSFPLSWIVLGRPQNGAKSQPKLEKESEPKFEGGGSGLKAEERDNFAWEEKVHALELKVASAFGIVSRSGRIKLGLNYSQKNRWSRRAKDWGSNDHKFCHFSIAFSTGSYVKSSN